MEDCIFCKIAAGQTPTGIVLEDDTGVVLHDINPQAPVHLLVIPRQHIASLSVAQEGTEPLLGHLCRLAAAAAEQAGIDQSGYRVVVNTGPDAGQAVAHLHLHVLGGRALSWPPG